MIMEYDQKTISESIHTEWAGKTVHFAKETETYQRYLGEINQKLAVLSDQVVEVVYGIPVYHKQELPPLDFEKIHK